jgi:hypothetical protein
MADFHLAIVGGCLTHQHGIPFNTLYHRQLARAVNEREGVTVRTHVARAVSSDYIERLDSLRERRPVDGVLLHVRVMVMKRSRALVEAEPGNRLPYVPHPAMFSRTHSAAAVTRLRAKEASGRVTDAVDGDEERPRRTEHRAGLRIGGFRVRDLNWTLGALLRLDRWAVDDEMLRMDEFIAACAQRELPVFVLGPTPLARSRWQARTLRLLNGRLADYCRREDIPLALVNQLHGDDGLPLLMADGMHLTTTGHTLVAQRLLAAGIGPWMRRA